MIYIFAWLFACYVCSSYKPRPSRTPTEEVTFITALYIEPERMPTHIEYMYIVMHI
jgi:hypothetical protein